MFTIDSNIAGVLRQTDDLIERRIPQAMQDAFHPELWFRDARDLAVRTILAIADQTERKYIADFAQTVTTEFLEGGGLSLKMKSPFPPLRDILSTAQAARAALNPQDLMQSLFLMPVQEFEDLMLKWVQEEKRKDARDYGKSDEDVASLISYIMLSPNLTPGGKGEQARAKLMPHIVDYLNRKQAASRLPEETVDKWLRAVLAAWRELVRIKYPEKVLQILHAKEATLL